MATRLGPDEVGEATGTSATIKVKQKYRNAVTGIAYKFCFII